MTGRSELDLASLEVERGYWYLGSPYSLYPGGAERACEDVSRIAAALTELRVRVFCPIAHSHVIAEAGGLDKWDWELWSWHNAPFIRWAHGLIVAKMEGWEDSRGLSAEIDEFEKAGKPIVYLDPVMLGL